MIKNNKNKVAEPSVFLILLGALKGYLRSPLFFLIFAKLSFKKFKKGIDLDLPIDFINLTGFTAWVYICLKKKMGQEKAFEILRAALLTTGLAVQQANFKNVECPRNFENLKKFQQETNQVGITKLNTMEIIEDSDKRYEFNVTRCLFLELFTHLGVPELTSIMCSVDNAIFNTYLPEKITFHRDGLNKTLYHKNEYCKFVIENNE